VIPHSKCPRNAFVSAPSFEIWKRPEMSWSHVERVRCMVWHFFLLKIATLETENMSAHCGAISRKLSILVARGIVKPFQHLQLECLVNSRHFGYRFKVDDIIDVNSRLLFWSWTSTFLANLTSGNSSISTPWTGVWPRDHTDNTILLHH
jgi:hypothetical protein